MKAVCHFTMISFFKAQLVDALYRPHQKLDAIAPRIRVKGVDIQKSSYIIAGLGQGWMEQEFATSNVSIKERGKRIEEYIEALRAIWGPDPVSFEGSFYHIP